MLAKFKFIGLSFPDYIPSQCPPTMFPRLTAQDASAACSVELSLHAGDFIL